MADIRPLPRSGLYDAHLVVPLTQLTFVPPVGPPRKTKGTRLDWSEGNHSDGHEVNMVQMACSHLQVTASWGRQAGLSVLKLFWLLGITLRHSPVDLMR